MTSRWRHVAVQIRTTNLTLSDGINIVSEYFLSWNGLMTWRTRNNRKTWTFASCLRRRAKSDSPSDSPTIGCCRAYRWRYGDGDTGDPYHFAVFGCTASTLGVTFDGPLMTFHISSVCRTSFFQLRQRTIRRSLMHEATRALVQAFVSCRLDYCNLPHFLPSLPTSISVACSRYRMRQLVWSPAFVVMTTSRRSSRHFIGFQFVSGDL